MTITVTISIVRHIPQLGVRQLANHPDT